MDTIKENLPCHQTNIPALTEWFADWFDSPYYHILYQNRDEQEARFFIDNLVKFLAVQPQHRLLDLACGKGRHAIYLNQKGFEVVGADLSETNIKSAHKASNDRLHFVVHDMREVLAENHFDYVFNLFTSFGYFEEDNENIKTLQAIGQALKPNGILVIDFLNPLFTVQNLVSYEVKSRENIDFHIYKHIENGYIIKDICFEDEGQRFSFQERVRLLDLPTFQLFFAQAGFSVEHIFGDYALNPFQEKQAERMIFIVRK